MRKVVVLSMAVMFVVFLGSALCQDIDGRWYAGAAATYVQPEDAEFKEKLTGLGRIFVGKGINNNLSAELEADSFRMKSKTGSKVRVSSVLASLELRKKFGVIYPYALAGLGWSFFSFDGMTPAETKDKSNSYAYKLGAGVEYFLNKDWALNYEAAHFYTDTGDTHSDVWNWQHSIGIKYYF